MEFNRVDTSPKKEEEKKKTQAWDRNSFRESFYLCEQWIFHRIPETALSTESSDLES